MIALDNFRKFYVVTQRTLRTVFDSNGSLKSFKNKMTLFIFNLARTLNRRQKIGAITALALTIIFFLLRYFAYSNNYEVYPYIPSIVIKPRQRAASNLKIPRVIHQTWKSVEVPEALHSWILRHAKFKYL